MKLSWRMFGRLSTIRSRSPVAGWLAAVGIICLSGWLGAFAQPVSPAPARIVTQYALTSSWRSEDNNPASWRLLGSNDRGQTWTVLDLQTNRNFRMAERQPFEIRNRTPYNIYRLQIDRASWADSITNERPSIRSDVQLAEIELIGPLVDGYAEQAVQPLITASQEHPITGLPENAFDGDPETRWRGDGVGKPGGCWIQCEYALESKTVVTNLSQITILAYRTGSRGRLSEKGPRIQAALDAKGGGMARVLSGYALVSANDLSGGDPRDWRLLGSNNDGKSWILLDERRDELFSRRFERRVFTVTNQTACTLFRLQIQAVREQGSDVQIAEVEPLFAKTETGGDCTLVVDASVETPPLEAADQAFDGEPKTKWVSTWSPKVTNWLQWRCVPAEDGVPVVHLRELERLADAQYKARWLRASESPMTRILSGYALTSGNDYPDRDPRAWQLLGSNDAGKTWVVLDVRTNEVFGSRLERREYLLERSAAYGRFRLQIDEVAVPQTANSVQLAEIEPLYAPAEGGKHTGLVVSAKGANGFWESVDKAFDGRRETKWLDYSDPSTRYSSWVEWQYVTNSPAPVVNLNRLLQSQAQEQQKLIASLDGVVVAWDAQAGELGFLDSTGFQMLALSTNDMQIDHLPQANPANREAAGSNPTALDGIRAGALFHLSGQLRFDGVRPRILHPHLEVSGWLPDQGLSAAGASPDVSQGFVMGTIKGQARTVARGRDYTTLRLTDDSGTSWEVQVLNSASLRLPSWLDCPVRARGVIQSLYDEQGRLKPGAIWIAGPQQLHFEPTENQQQDASEGRGDGPLVQAEDVLKAVKARTSEDYPVRMRGIITYIDMGLDEFYLQSGNEGFRVHCQPNAGLFPHLGQEGSYVELHGLVRDGGLYCTDAVKWLGRGKLPKPRQHSWDYLMTGKDDDQWVELEGVAGAVQKQRLILGFGGNRVVIWVNEMDKQLEKSLPGSLVRVAGICSPVFNSRGQRLGLRLLTPFSECIEVINAMPSDPFGLPLVPVGGIVKGGTNTSIQLARMIRTSGIVTYSGPQLLFIQNGEDGLPVATRTEAQASIGDEIEVAGVVQADGFSPKLVEALIRKTGQGHLPAPRVVKLLTSEAANTEEYHDATRVVLEAVLLAKRSTESDQVLMLQQTGAQQTFSARVPIQYEAVAALPIGSRLRLAGVLKAKCDTAPDFDQTVNAFELYVNSTSDITVLEQPSWWTARHALWVLGGAGGVLALAVTWVLLLRRKVNQRTRELHDEIEGHKRTEKQLDGEIFERKSALRFQQVLLDSIPIPVFYKSKSGVFLGCNKSFEQFMAVERGAIVGKSVIDINSPELAQIYMEQDAHLIAHRGVQIYECDVPGKTQGSKHHVVFHKATFEGPDGDVAGIIGGILDITALKEAEFQKERVITELKRALENVKLLTGLLPICASCKKIRDDKGYWNHLETYISKRSDVEFSHGICPDCAKKFFPDYCNGLDAPGDSEPHNPGSPRL